MRRPRLALHLLTLCLALLLLAAQLHFCNDLGPAASGHHVCQLCAIASHAIAVQSLVAELTPAICRLELSCVSVDASSFSFSSTSPRAPPAL